MIVLHTTTPSKKEAKHLAKILLENRFVACAQITKIRSYYTWNEQIAHEKEYLLILKTHKKHKKNIQKILKKYHSYELPQMIFLKAKASKAYQQWLHENLI